MSDNASKFYTPGLMDLSKYHIISAPLDDHWDRFVESSPQGTIFQTTPFLSCFSNKFCSWYCLKKNQIVGAMVVPVNDAQTTSMALPHMIHNGLMFIPAQNNQNQSQTLSEHFRISLCFIEKISKHFKEVSLTHHPSHVDMRPFLWHNYHNNDPKYSVEIRYTSYLRLKENTPFDLSERDELFKACNTSRRQEIRAGIRESLRTDTDVNPERFASLYETTFNTQGIKHSMEEQNELVQIITTLNKAGKLRMFSTYDLDNNLGSSAVFGVDTKRAYFLYGGNHPEFKKQAFGSTVLWDAFQALHAEGIREIDLEGVNSPARGYFKLSFGGDLVPYYRTHWKS